MSQLERFKRYAAKFRSSLPRLAVKQTLGDVLADEVGKAVQQRIHEVLPYYVSEHGKITIRSSTSSFWDKEKKSIVATYFIEFGEDIKWKDEEENKTAG